MDAVKFIKERNRMCRSFSCRCSECPAFKSGEYAMHCVVGNKSTTNVTTQIAIVEEWSSAHPPKTRQSKFLEQYPNAQVDERNVLCACPANVYGEEVCLNDSAFCSDCCRDFWSQEIE